MRGLAASITGLTFHPDDVPVFQWPDALEVVRDLLTEHGWRASGSAELSWGDSSVGFWRVYVDPMSARGRVTVSRHETWAADPDESTTFEGDWRLVVPRALAFIAANQADVVAGAVL